MKARFLFALSVGAVYVLSGCGGGGGGSTPDPATIAPLYSSVFIEGTIRPQGSLKSDVESLASSVGGIEDPGAKILDKIEAAAEDADTPFSFEKEVEPWLGEKGGIFLAEYDGKDFSAAGAIVQVTDSDAAKEFLKKHAKSGGGEAAKEFAHEAFHYWASPDGTSIGVIGDFIVATKSQEAYKQTIDTFIGTEHLPDRESYSEAIAAVPSDSLASVFVDIGALIRSGGGIDPQAQLFLETAGIEPTEATAVASVIPSSDKVEIDVSSNLAGKNPPAGDASSMLGSLPAGSVAALASPDFGKRLSEAIDGIDARGIPGQVPPHQFKSTLERAGINLDQITGNIGDLGVFAEGHDKSSLDGAVVLSAENPEQAKNTVSNVGLLLRASHTPGVTAIGGKASGVSIAPSQPGRKPIAVAAAGKRIAIGYGLPATLEGLDESGPTLSGAGEYKEAVSVLSDTPITGFVDGPGALQLAESFIPSPSEGFAEARPYLKKIAFIAIGSEAAEDRTTAKLIVGFKK